MEHEKKMQQLESVSVESAGKLKEVVQAIENIENRFQGLFGAVRELKEYDKANDFVMLPKFLSDDPTFREFWLNPSEMGGARELLAEAQKKRKLLFVPDV